MGVASGASTEASGRLSATVRCLCCHRVERWEGAAIEVRMPGGQRAPASPAPRAAFEVGLGWLNEENGPVVGTCSQCGQPLVCEQGNAPPIQWVVPLPDGELRVGMEGIYAGDTQLTLQEAERRVRSAYPLSQQWTRTDVLRNSYLTATLPFIVFPVFLWCCAVLVLVVFYSHWASGGGSVGMP